MIAVPCDATRGSTRSERGRRKSPACSWARTSDSTSRRKAAFLAASPGEKLVTRHARRLLDGLGEEGFSTVIHLAPDSVVSNQYSLFSNQLPFQRSFVSARTSA